MSIRVTRPGFINGMRALAASEAPVPAIPSIDIWRAGSRKEPYDPNRDASRNEMRSFVCGQCHVEYYCSTKMPLTFPWGKGLTVDDAEAFWNATKFPDGSDFVDYKHAETGAPILKAQHPEFELWSQGIHARSGVSCADCHMPYMREGAAKVSDHWVRSPLLNVSRACQTCHRASEGEMQARVAVIQGRNYELMQRGGKAVVELIDAILAQKAQGKTDAELAPALDLQRRAQWRLDYIAAENSMGFHAPQEAARILGEAIDYARQGQVAAMTGKAPEAPPAAPAGEAPGAAPTAPVAPTAPPAGGFEPGRKPINPNPPPSPAPTAH
jgi:nitrite reductase (cytochrome c-552)